MKYIAIILLFFSFKANAQIKYTPMSAGGYEMKYLKADSGFILPFRDTSIGRGADRPGVIAINISDSLPYYYNGKKWKPVYIDSSGIIHLIDVKVDSVTVSGNDLFYWVAGTGYGTQLNKLDSIHISSDSIFTCIAGNCTFQYIFGIDSSAYHTMTQAPDSSYATLNKLNGVKDTLVVVADGLTGDGTLLQQVFDNSVNTGLDTLINGHGKPFLMDSSNIISSINDTQRVSIGLHRILPFISLYYPGMAVKNGYTSALLNRGLTSDRYISFPDNSGTIALSLNGTLADETGNINYYPSLSDVISNGGNNYVNVPNGLGIILYCDKNYFSVLGSEVAQITVGKSLGSGNGVNYASITYDSSKHAGAVSLSNDQSSTSIYNGMHVGNIVSFFTPSLQNGNYYIPTSVNHVFADTTGNIKSIDSTVTLSSGTITVSDSRIKSGAKIFLSVNTPSGTQGFLSAPTSSIIDGTSFIINSTSATENSTVNYSIINQ